MRVLLAQLPEGLLIVGPEGTIRYANPRADELFGYAEGELTGHPLGQLIPAAAPAAQPSHRADSASHPPTLPLNLSPDARGRRKDGSEFPVAVTLHHLPDGALLATVREQSAGPESLIEFQAVLAQVVQAAADLRVAVLDPSGMITATNPPWDESARSRGGVSGCGVGVNYLDVCRRATGPHSEEAPAAERGVAAVLRGEAERFTTTYSCPDSAGVQWFRLTAAALPRYGGAVVFHQDVTQQRAVENTLALREEQFQALFQHLPVAMVCWQASGADFILIAYNRLAERLTEGKIVPMLGSRLSEVHADRPGHAANVARCYRERTSFEAEFHWERTPWGPELQNADVQISYAFAPPDLVMGSLRVVTEQKRQERERLESEERHRLLLSALREGVVLLDAGGGVLTCNASAARLFGCEHAELLGRPLAELLPSALGEDGRPIPPDLLPWELARRKGAAVDSVPLIAACNGGPAVHLVVNARAVPAAPGEPHAVVVSFADVTSRWLAQEQLRQRQAELAHVARFSTVGEMAAVLAHEVNQPLTAVVNYCRGGIVRLRQEDWDPAQVAEALNLAVAQAERASRILAQVREFTRKRESQRALTSLDEIIHDSLALVRPELRHHRVEVATRLAADIPRLSVDRVQIEQVLLNLIRNAVDAMAGVPAPDRWLVIETEKVAPNAHVRVIDSGAGLDAERLQRVFEPFYTTKEQGMGLGLAISRSIAESHGGKLLAAAAPVGTGMMFVLVLPLHAGGGIAGGGEG